MKSINIVMLGLLAAIPVAADQLTFSGQTAGTYDLTAASTWGGVEPSSASELFVTKSGNTFTAAHDFSFTGLYFTSSSITNVIELDEGRTVTVLASGHNVGVKAGYDSTTQNPKFTHTTFKGGKWDLNGTANIAPFYHYSYGKYTNTYVFTDGVVVTNVNVFSAGYNSTGHSVTLDKGSKVFMKSPKLFEGTCHDCSFTLKGGSLYYAETGNPAILTGGNNNKITISGDGTRFVSAEKYPYFVHNYPGKNNRLVIENGAVMSVPSFYYSSNSGAAGSRDNVISVTKSGKLDSRGVIYFNTGSHTTNNVFEITDGGEVTTKNIFSFGGNNNYGTTLIISNGTLNCVRVYQNQCSPYNSVFRIIGENSVYNASYDSTLPIFSCGTGCVFSIEDKASWTYDHSLAFGYTQDCGSFNTVRLLNGAKLKSRDLSMGSAAEAITNCTIFVGNDCVLETRNDLRCFAANNTLVVSNGTVKTGTTIHWGRFQEGFLTTNNTIVLQGNKPKIQIANNDQIQLRNYTCIRFELPERGYLTSEPLIEAGYVVIDTQPKVEIAGLEKFQRKLQETTSVVLFKLTGQDPDGTEKVLPYPFRNILNALNETLPEGCSISYTNYDITLTVRAVYKSTVIFIK